MGQNEKTILITGGAGYVGSALVQQLLQRGYQVRVLDTLLHGGNALLPFLYNSRFELVVGDIRLDTDLDTTVRGIYGIVHLAAIVGEPACNHDPELAVAVNTIGSELLCRKAVSQGVKRFVFASTCSNYGTMSTDDTYLDETSPLKPISVYSETKVGFERYLLGLNRDGFYPTCLRFATAFGLSLRPRFDLTVNEFAKELALGRKLEVFGEQFWRPYCHVRDLANACVLTLEADEDDISHQAFNVGSNSENYRKKQLVELILKQLPQMADNVTYVERNDDPRNYRVSFDKINSTLGFTAKRKVADGIEEIIKALKLGLIKNPDDRSYRNL